MDILNFWLSISGVMLKSRTAKIGAIFVRSRAKSAFCTDCTGTYLILKLATNRPLIDSEHGIFRVELLRQVHAPEVHEGTAADEHFLAVDEGGQAAAFVAGEGSSTGMSVQSLRCMRSVNTGARQLPEETITLPA